MNDMNSSGIDLQSEWLEADGLGGFASGTIMGRRTRRYHAVLLTAATPPSDRKVLVSGFEATVTAGTDSYAISTQHYLPDVIYPRGFQYLQTFNDKPWPKWVYRLPNGLVIEFELFVPRGYSGTVLKWQLQKHEGDDQPQGVELVIRPLICGRDYHSLQHEDSAFRFDAAIEEGQITWQLNNEAPAVTAFTNGDYTHSPEWYRQFLYAEEATRGLDASEDLASPGVLRFPLSVAPAFLVLTDNGPECIRRNSGESVDQLAQRMALGERTRRSAFATRLHRAAADYLVRRGSGQTIVAGYPWFTDWGRDTFIALRGLCLAAGRIDEAGQILTQWSQVISQGMLPNRFPDQGDVPEYNSVDASLWYIIAVYDYLNAARIAAKPNWDTHQKMLSAAVNEILQQYMLGTRFGIRMDEDGLLSAGEPGVQLTWMDAKCGDWIATPRMGKPVEIQALWINALWIGSRTNSYWEPVRRRARESFLERYWNPLKNCLYDVVDVDHRLGQNDDSLRPNQIFAVGGLPLNLMPAVKAQHIVQIVEDRLLTPMGLRTLEQRHPDYCGVYRGGVRERDAAYHQGAVWPWLMGAFVQGWLRVRRNSTANRQLAASHFVQPLLDHMQTAGQGHVSEIADGDFPHRPGGCPFQAWSVGELLRMLQMVAEPIPGQTANGNGSV
ncbi:MAG: amylo-alpha-1,6-glucosidase [Planctomycetaceae bacterium]